ncbi:MAG TPA: glycosyltransferase [Solirubrobacteraceae bacterium]
MSAIETEQAADTERAIDISVIVPVRNEASVLRETAASMLAQSFDGELELLFVDGCSEDGSLEILAELAEQDSRVRVLENPKQIEPAALNIGVGGARGTYVALLNAHCWFPQDYLARGVERLKRGDVSWVTGPAIPRGRDRFSRGVALALVSPLGAGGSKKWASADAPAAPEVELDTGLFAGVVRRDTLRSLGPFQEGWLVNHDSEMAARVIGSKGRIVMLSAMGAYYHPRNTPAGLWRQYWRFGRYRVKTAQLHPLALRPFHLLSAGLAASPIVAVAAPRPLRRFARATLATYALTLAAASTVTVRGEQERDPGTLATVFAVMHLGWGAGFLSGCLRWGPPWKGIAHAVGFRRDVEELTDRP